jgi:hypothetical protein
MPDTRPTVMFENVPVELARDLTPNQLSAAQVTHLSLLADACWEKHASNFCDERERTRDSVRPQPGH